MMRKSTMVLCLISLSLVVVRPALAEDGGGGGGYAYDGEVDVGGLTVWGIVSQHRRSVGLGVGMHYMIPVGEGVLTETTIRDRFAVEFGVDVATHFYREDQRPYLRLRPAVGVLWTLWILDELALYPKIDVGFPIFFLHDHWDWWFLNGAVGLLYRLDDFDFRVEAGWYGLHVGALFRF